MMETDSINYNREYKAYTTRMDGKDYLWDNRLDGWVELSLSDKEDKDKVVIKDEKFSLWFRKIKEMRDFEKKTSLHHRRWARRLADPDFSDKSE